MNKDRIKKIAAGIVAAGGIAGGTLEVSDRINCDYEFTLDGETVCLTEEQKDIISQEIKNQTFDTVGDLTL